jgi:hypothetical protein
VYLEWIRRMAKRLKEIHLQNQRMLDRYLQVGGQLATLHRRREKLRCFIQLHSFGHLFRKDILPYSSNICFQCLSRKVQLSLSCSRRSTSWKIKFVEIGNCLTNFQICCIDLQ